MLATTAEAQRKIIAERVHLQRWRLRGRSQRKLSTSLGWGANRVGQVERGETDLNVFELYALAEALQTTVDYLLGITDDPSGGKSTATVGYGTRNGVFAGQRRVAQPAAA